MINKLKTAYSNYALKIFFTLLASSVIYSCSNDDDPEDIHEHENITRVSIVFKKALIVRQLLGMMVQHHHL